MAQALTRAQTELATIETTKAEVEASLERLNREIADLLPAELAGGQTKSSSCVETPRRRWRLSTRGSSTYAQPSHVLIRT